MPDKKPTTGEDEQGEFEQMAEEYIDALETPQGEDVEDGFGLNAGEESEEEDDPAAAAADDDHQLDEDESQGEEETEEEEEAQEPSFTLPDTELYGELRGQKVNLNQLAESGLLTKMLTRDHQEMHHTNLYQELKKSNDELKAKFEEFTAPRAEPDPEPQGPPIDPATASAAVQAHYFPGLAQAAKDGVFEGDFLEAYPQVATQLEHRFQLGSNAIVEIAKRIGVIEERVTGVSTRVESDDSSSYLTSQIDNLAQSDERLFGRLADDGHRSEFLKWTIDEENPLPYKDMDMSQMTPEVLASAYVSYLHANRGSAPPKPKPKRKRKPNMSGDTGGSTARDQGGVDPNEFDELRQGLEEVHDQRLNGI